MKKSAKQIVTDSMFSSLVDVMNALRKDNVDMGVLRETKAIHNNTCFNDLPEPVRRALVNAAEQAFIKLYSEGYQINTQ